MLLFPLLTKEQQFINRFWKHRTCTNKDKDDKSDSGQPFAPRNFGRKDDADPDSDTDSDMDIGGDDAPTNINQQLPPRPELSIRKAPKEEPEKRKKRALKRKTDDPSAGDKKIKVEPKQESKEKPEKRRMKRKQEGTKQGGDKKIRKVEPKKENQERCY